MEAFGSNPADSTNRFGRPQLSEEGTWITPIGELYDEPVVSVSAETVESPVDRNDEALFRLAAISACVPTDSEDYIVMHNAYLEITGDVSLTAEVRSLSEDNRLELATTYPELHIEAMDELKSRTQEIAIAAGIGKYALRKAI